MLLKGATHNLTVRTRSTIALYLLNQKRAHLRALEERFRIAILVSADETVGGQTSFLIEKGEQVHSLEQARALAQQSPAAAPLEEEDEGDEPVEDDAEAAEAEAAGASEEPRTEGEQAEPGQGRKRRRRRRGRRGGEPRDADQPMAGDGSGDVAEAFSDAESMAGEHDGADPADALEAGATALADAESGEAAGERERRRRRGRRGGRRNRRSREGERLAPGNGGALEPEPMPAAADPEGGPFAEPEPVRGPAIEAPADPPAGGAQTPRELPSAAAPPAHPAASEPYPASPVARLDQEPALGEPPRRRSTVREPAPAAPRSETPPPVPELAPPATPTEPVITDPAESESTDRPRRSGWWSKRVLGRG
jgi:ribonuclease E